MDNTTALPHPATLLDLWNGAEMERLDELIAHRHALMRREADQEATQ